MTENSESFTETEVDLIRMITADWLNEGIVLPPFDSNLAQLLKKLGLEETNDAEPEIFPKTQEWLSRHGVKK